MTLVRTFTIAFASLALTLAAAAPALPAEACGGYARAPSAQQVAAEAAARAAVEAHFAALAKGDAKAVRKVWAPTAVISSFSVDGKVTRTERLGKALPRWLRAREGLTWTVNDAYAAGDGTISITVDVAWDGAKYADVLTLAEVDGRWRITAKASHRQARTEARFGGY